MKATHLTLFLCSVIVFSLNAQNGKDLPNSNLIRDLLEKGDSLQSAEGNADNARRLYRKVIELDPDNAYKWLFTSVLTGYPGHLWKNDPVFSKCHDIFAFREHLKQARIRVESEYQD